MTQHAIMCSDEPDIDGEPTEVAHDVDGEREPLPEAYPNHQTADQESVAAEAPVDDDFPVDEDTADASPGIDILDMSVAQAANPVTFILDRMGDGQLHSDPLAWTVPPIPATQAYIYETPFAAERQERQEWVKSKDGFEHAANEGKVVILRTFWTLLYAKLIEPIIGVKNAQYRLTKTGAAVALEINAPQHIL